MDDPTDLGKVQDWTDFDIPRYGSFLVVNDRGLRGNGQLHVNATSTRIRRFGAVDAGEKRSISVVVGMENARKQRLGA